MHYNFMHGFNIVNKPIIFALISKVNFSFGFFVFSNAATFAKHIDIIVTQLAMSSVGNQSQCLINFVAIAYLSYY